MAPFFFAFLTCDTMTLTGFGIEYMMQPFEIFRQGLRYDPEK